MPTRMAAAGPSRVRSGRLELVAELLIAVNPDEDSRLPYLLRIPQPGGDLLFRTSGTWPRVKALYCDPVGLDEWPTDALIFERLPLRSCRRRGATIDVILQRSRENRSQLVSPPRGAATRCSGSRRAPASRRVQTCVLRPRAPTASSSCRSWST